MGYYTKFNVFVTLRRDTPQSVLDTVFELIYGTPEIIDEHAAYGLREIYKNWKPKPVFNHTLFELSGSTGMRIFHHFNGYSHPYIRPQWGKDWDKYKEDPINYKPYWNVHLLGDLNYAWEALHQLVDYLGPYLAGHKPKQYMGWYQGEDQQQRVNLYYKRKLQ